MAPHPTDQDWRRIAEQASRETDPARLTTLIANLCLALDREREQRPEFGRQEGQSDSSSNVAQQHAE